MKYSQDTYLKYNPYQDECEVLYHNIKLVKTRKEHDCMLAFNLMHDPMKNVKPHKIPSGNIARLDSAMVEGEWGKSYACINCMDKYLEDVVDNG